MQYLVVGAIVGAGLITGLLFAFSNFVMSALAELSNEKGMLAMQKINERIINPLFMVFFLGTALLCVIIVFRTATNLTVPSNNMPLFFGAVCYLLGPIGVTMLFNVPLNNQLAETKPSDADKVWGDYQTRWQRWNHVRTVIGALSILLLALGL